MRRAQTVDVTSAVLPVLQSWPSEDSPALADTDPVAGTDPPLMGLAARPESCRSIGIAPIGYAIPLRRCLSARPCGLPERSTAGPVKLSPPASHRVSPPSRVLRERRWPRPRGLDAFSGLSSPVARSIGEVRFTRALPARHLPSSGFGYPLDGFLPRRPSRACFIPAVPWGTAPSKHLLAGGCPTLLSASARLPLSADLASTNRRFTEAGTCGPGFRVLPLASPEPLELGRGPIHRPVAPMGFRPFQGTPATALIDLPADLLSRAWSWPRLPVDLVTAPQSLDRRPLGPTARAGHPS